MALRGGHESRSTAVPTLEFRGPDWLQERTTGRERSREVVVGPRQRAED